MRISDWSSDVCSSDLPSAMRCEAANDKNFIDIVRRLAPISRHRILPTVGMARSVIYNSATSADSGRHCRRGFVPDRHLEARKSVVYGKRVSVRVDLGGGGII